MENRIEPPVHMLPASMKEAVVALEELSGIPPEVGMSVALAVANFACQGLADTTSGGRFGNRPLSEFFMILAPSGGAKTHVMKSLMGGVQQWQEAARERYEAEQLEYRIHADVWDQEEAAAKKIKDPREQASRRIELAKMKPLAPVDYRRFLEEPTKKGLYRRLERVPSAALFTSEGGQFLKSHAFQDGTTMLNLMTTLTNLWDGNPLSRDVGDESSEVRNRRFNLLLMVQEEVAREFLGNETLGGQGIHARLLVTVSRPWTVPAWRQTPEDQRRRELVKARIANFDTRIFALLSQGCEVREGAPLEVVPPVLGLGTEADEVFAVWDETTVLPRLENDPSPFLMRVREHAIRLAGTLAVFDGYMEIKPQHAEAAVALVDFFISQHDSLDVATPDRRVSDELPIGEKLIKWMRAKGKDAICRTDFRSAPNVFRKLNVDKQQRIIDSLVIREYLEGAVQIAANGREIETWTLTEFGRECEIGK